MSFSECPREIEAFHRMTSCYTKDFGSSQRVMNHLAVFLLATSVTYAADFVTGQAARLVIGQSTFTSQNPTSSDVVLGGVSGLAYVNNMLVAADSNRVGAGPANNRVLLFQNLSQMLPAPTAKLPVGVRCPVCTGTATLVLGQPDFTTSDVGVSPTNLRQPTAVASDGTLLVVADTDNNRVLIWKTIPTTNAAPADLVLGQPDFKGNAPNNGTGDTRVPGQKTLRGPQGVWIQGGKLYVADTQNHRVLVWNSIPTSNFQPADLELGQPNFASAIEPDLTKATVDAQATSLLNPVSVTSDGVRLYVTDLGHNRVLIWNSLPTQNQQPADVALGQPDLTSAVANNSSKMCASNGTDSSGNATYPDRCSATLSFPRFALSDGRRLFIADGGNDRVLVFSTVPTQTGASADIILGQVNGEMDLTSESANPLGQSASDSLSTPMSLAWDGANLYVSDPFNRRILVFTVGSPTLPYTAVRNAASLDVYAVGSITLGGTIQEGDEITVTIQDRNYKYKIVKDDTLAGIVRTLVDLINAGNGDADVLATPNITLGVVILTARTSGEAGNSVAYSVTTSDNAVITLTTGGATLAGGQDAAKIAPGTLVTVLGDNLADSTADAPPGADPLPTELAGVEVYFDGMRAPLLHVSPTQINAQMPFEVNDSWSVSAYVRIQRRDGSVDVSTAVGVPIITANPGIFALGGTDPRPGVVMHGSSQASGTVSVDGTATAGDVATVIIEDRQYTYTVQEGDDLAKIRDGLIALINDDPKVYAFSAGLFTRIRLRARVEGPEGNGIAYSTQAAEGANVILTATTPELCCANVAYSLVTDNNPALPGETIIVYATGLGIVQPDAAKFALDSGVRYKGPLYNEPLQFVSSLAGGKTANVLFCGIKQGEVGIYEVHLELNSDMPTNPVTQVTIAQDVYVSNIVSFPLFNPRPSQ